MIPTVGTLTVYKVVGETEVTPESSEVELKQELEMIARGAIDSRGRMNDGELNYGSS